jgi:hypothetical protein
MVEDIKKSYEEYADLQLGNSWRKCNKNDLFRDYIKNESIPNIREGYLSAIICRYWSNIDNYFYRSKSSATIEEVYVWLLEAALYTLRKRMWENPKSSIYKDPNGPDKVMNRMIKSHRLLHYEKTNTAKRRLNFGSTSLDYLRELEEDKGIYSLPSIRDDNLEEGYIKNIITDSFNKKDFFTSFMVYNIVNQDVFNHKGDFLGELNTKKLNHCMRNLDDRLCKSFSKEFNFNLSYVKEAAKSCNCLPNNRVYTAIKRSLGLLSKSPYLNIQEV